MSNVCAAAAYRSGESLRSKDDDEIKYPHRNNEDIVFSAIINYNW